uniref:BHLH domain-containing protein n=1 Tax=Caenorhabditis tropicalis TaxID=1561998 RepID=A0A1I7UY82_9PELO
MLRNSINSRERRRMHELNDEFEALRECLPYPNEANSRRMSKANTLLLASNWIKQLVNANHKLQLDLNAAHAKVVYSKFNLRRFDFSDRNTNGADSKVNKTSSKMLKV